MKKYFNGFLGFSFAIISVAQLGAQTFVIDRIEQADDKLIVHFALNDDNASHQYLVQLFCSQDNFTTALTKVSGDVGTEVSPDPSKKIIWDATKELGSFKGDVSFEVRGRVYVPFVKLKDLNEGDVFKRGSPHPLVWTSGNLSGQVNIELIKGDQMVDNYNNQPNVGRYDWVVPYFAKPGKDYRLKFTNTKDRADVVYSKSFTIKPKIPFLIKALGVAVVGGGIALVLLSKSTSGQAPVIETSLPSLDSSLDHP